VEERLQACSRAAHHQRVVYLCRGQPLGMNAVLFPSSKEPILGQLGNILSASAVYVSAAQRPDPSCRTAWGLRRREASNIHMMGFELPTAIQGWFQRSTQEEYQPLRTETVNSEARAEPKPHCLEERRRLALFEELALPHLDAVHNFARWLMRNDDEAQEVAQETFLRALRYFDSYRGSDAKAWLSAILRNTCSTWRRRKRQTGATESFDEGMHSPQRAMRDQEQQTIDAGEMVTLRQCIEMLPLEYREVLIMRELEEMSYRQISEVMAVPVGTVMSRLSRARRRLGEYAPVAAMRKR
jgi:RNA polymerase sigma-70 factor (ECF subfamily)